MQEKRVRVGIIGGGLSGTIVAMKLLHYFKETVEIVMFERNPRQLFRGIAYSSSLKFQPLNVRASQMNIWRNRPGDFYQWLGETWDRYFAALPDASAFIRRDVFGDYLEQCFKKVAGDIGRNQSLRIVYDEVKQIEKDDGKLKLTTESTSVTVDFTVLALGNFLPGDIPIQNMSFYQSPYYQANPWNVSWMSDLDRDDEVLFLGSGLTTIDQVINLLNSDHRGKINILSRRGFIPKAHRAYPPVEISPLPVYLGISANEVLRLVRLQIEKYSDTGTDWRNVVDAVRNQVPQIWAYWSLEERKRFLRHIRPFWEIHRHRIPEESLRIIEDNIHSGRIQVHAGRLVDIKVEEGTAAALIKPRGADNLKKLRVQKVVNCTGPQTDFRKIRQPLIKDLMAKGWLQTDELNLGLAVNRDGQLIGADGNVLNNIFTIGSLRKGAMWECTALREIALQADQFVSKLNPDFVSL